MVDTVYVTYDDILQKAKQMPEFEAENYTRKEDGSTDNLPDLEIFWEVFDEMRTKRLGGCDDVVMKPATGNGAVGVRRWPADDEDTYEEDGTGEGDFWDQFRILSAIEDDTIMFQCFQKQILTKGTSPASTS
jgi:hypothetical protein